MTNKFPIAVIIAGVLIAGAIIYVNVGQPTKEEAPEEKTSGVLSSQEVGEKVINFINQNILRGRATASLVSALEENELYKIKFNIGGEENEVYVTRDGKFLFPEAIDLSEAQPPAVEKGLTIGNFSVSGDDVCKENDRPIVYFFGSESCPHCQWEHPIMAKVAEKFKGEIAFHNNMDSENDMEVLSRYSSGGIPTLVLGCKYYRVGSGEGAGEEEETKVLTALICKLTDGKPSDLCNQVQDLINQIK